MEIENIKIEDLTLWAGNLREPFDYDLKELSVLELMIKDESKKWKLRKLVKEMGDHYDTSELPTVVKKNGKNIVFDGNRRVAVLKILKHIGLRVMMMGNDRHNEKSKLLSETKTLPCFVCDEATAMQKVARYWRNKVRR